MRSCRSTGCTWLPIHPFPFQHVTRCLKDQYPQVRAAAALAIGGLGVTVQPEEAAAVAKLLRETSVSVRVAACRSLRACGPEIVQEYAGAIAAVLRHEEEDVRAAACLTLGAHRDAAGIAVMPLALKLRDAARNQESSTYQAAREALTVLGPGAVPYASALLTWLCHVKTDMRRSGCEALGALGHATVVAYADALMRRLQDDDHGVREAACTALWELGRNASLEHASAVAACLNDEDCRVRAAACQALEGFGPVAAPHLRPWLGVPATEVCEAGELLPASEATPRQESGSCDAPVLQPEVELSPQDLGDLQEP